jgi:hypothetical protein
MVNVVTDKALYVAEQRRSGNGQIRQTWLGALQS